jgi:CrcB protein
MACSLRAADMKYLLIASGGALGAMARYLMGTTIQTLAQETTFPLGTMMGNLLGCLLIGVIMGLAQFKGIISADLRLFLVVGILGGFTTFSSFGYETYSLFESGQIEFALTNALVQTCLGIALVWLGTLISRLL